MTTTQELFYNNKKTNKMETKIEITTRFLKKAIIFCVLFSSVFLFPNCGDDVKKVGPKYSNELPEKTIPVYHFVIHPLHNPVKMTQCYQPLIEYLNKKIDSVKFVLEASKNYNDFEKKYTSKLPEILLPNPWHTLQAIELGYNVIAMAGDSTDFKGIFIIRKDTKITNPIDLIGKKVSYPSETALAACIMPQNFLFRNGIDVNNDIENLYVGSQESSIMNVYMKISDVGATWPSPWRAFQKEFPKEASQLKVIWETETLINNSVMIREDLPEKLKSEIQQKLITLHETKEGKLILQKMETARFFESENKKYDIVRIYVSEFEKNVRPVNTKYNE